MTALARKIPLDELARAWGWPLHRLYRLCETRQIEHLKLAGKIFFEEAGIQEYLDEQRRLVERDDTRRVSISRAEECRKLGIPELHDFS